MKGETPGEPSVWTMKKDNDVWRPVKLNGTVFNGEGFALEFDSQTAKIGYSVGESIFVR